MQSCLQILSSEWLLSVSIAPVAPRASLSLGLDARSAMRLAVALGIMISVGAVRLKDRHPVAIDRAEANAELPNAQLSRVHLLLFSMK
jgi:hypothetical protein